MFVLSERSADQSEIESFTALRGVMALFIVVVHHNFYFRPRLTGIAFDNAYMLLDVFFVLSGFVMYYVYRAEFSAGTFSYKAFMIRRFARIYPVHFVTLMATVLLYATGGALGVIEEARLHLADFWANLFLVHAWGFTETLRLNYPSWSISAEWGAYLLFPLLIAPLFAVSGRAGLLIGAIFVTVFAIGYGLAFPQVEKTLFRIDVEGSFLRAIPEFFLGLAAAHAVMGKRLVHGGEIAVAASLAVCVFAFLYSLGILFALSTTALLMSLYLVDPKMPASAMFLGRISYSLYMTHAIVGLLIYKSLRALFQIGPADVPFWMLPLTVALSVVVGAVVYRKIEVPGSRFVVNLARSRKRRAAET